MCALLRTPRRQYRQSLGRSIRLSLERLEARTLPATLGTALPTLGAIGNHTLDQAQDLGDLTTLQRVQVNDLAKAASTANVDWYQFRLDRPATVTLRTLPDPPQPIAADLLSLYGLSSPGPGQRTGQTDDRLLAQDDGTAHAGQAQVTRALAAGVYFVALSSPENRYFHPLIADSGYAGPRGDEELIITTTDLGLGATDGPVVLATEPASGSDLARSPLAIHLDLSTPIDPASVHLGTDVQLRLQTGGPHQDSSQLVALAAASFDQLADDLQVTPAAPLSPGNYELLLSGNRDRSSTVLMNRADVPLGESSLHPTGNDFVLSFRVGGSKGNRAPNAGADDTPATAQELGELTGTGLVQVAGAIGDDPTAPFPFSPSDVDLYHFHLGGTERQAFTAEVFAGRVGSPLDPALSLFRLDPADGRLHLVDANDNSLNRTRTHDGQTLPLFTDPVLETGLIPGDYYLAVSSSPNVPMPEFGRLPGSGGIFDPLVTHSGTVGSSTGPYVLNVAAEPIGAPPSVLGVPSLDGIPLTQVARLSAPPTSLAVRFTQPVNLAALLRSGLPQLDAVYVVDGTGRKFFPALIAYDQTDSQALFRFRDASPNGDYQLHLSGSLGLADRAGNPLVGNDPSGDYVSRFTVNGPPRGSAGNPRLWLDQEPNADPAHAQQLGVLFPDELPAGILLQRTSPAVDASDTADYYRFQLLEPTLLSFRLNRSSDEANLQLTLTDATGQSIPLALSRSRTATSAVARLQPGSYLVGVRGWSAARAATVTYELSLVGQEPEQAPVLSIGPGPAIRITPLRVGNAASAVDAPIFPAGSVAPAATAAGSANLGAIPSQVFALVAAGPVGDPSGGSAAPRPRELSETILTHSPEVLFTQVVAQLPLLVPTQHSGTQESAASAGELAQLLRAVLPPLGRLPWMHVLDWISPTLPAPQRRSFRSVPAEAPERPENVQPAERERPSGPATREEATPEESVEAAAPSWAFAALLALSTSQEPSRRQGMRRGRR